MFSLEGGKGLKISDMRRLGQSRQRPQFPSAWELLDARTILLTIIVRVKVVQAKQTLRFWPTGYMRDLRIRKLRSTLAFVTPKGPEPKNRLPLRPLEFLVLAVLEDEPLHGYGMVQRIESRTGGVVRAPPGHLYRV